MRDRRPTNNSDVVLGSLELPERNVDGDTTLTLGLQFVQDPCVLEGTLAEFGGFLRDCQHMRGERRVKRGAWSIGEGALSQPAKPVSGLALAHKCSHTPPAKKCPSLQ